MASVPYLAQKTEGGCGACSFVMVARFFNPDLTLNEDDALREFGVDGFGPRCFALSPSFHRAADGVGLKALVTSMNREALRGHLAHGPVIVYHKASEVPDAVPHFSVALDATDAQITRHDPGFGPAIVDNWARFESLWSEARVSSSPHKGRYGVVLRPKS